MLGLGLTAQGSIFYQGTDVTGDTQMPTLEHTTIADGNVGGMWNVMDLTGQGLGNVLDIQVTLNISGGNNGDLYAYLSYNEVLVPLLNRIGVSSGNPFGSSGSGLNVTFSTAAAGNIHAAGDGTLSGSYQADGQNLSPLSPASSFNANGGSITLDAVGTGFGGMNPNGPWTLFISDVVSGGGEATLSGWSLDITVVPEPVNVTLAVFGVVAVVTVASRPAPVSELGNFIRESRNQN